MNSPICLDPVKQTEKWTHLCIRKQIPKSSHGKTAGIEAGVGSGQGVLVRGERKTGDEAKPTL